MPKRGMEPIRQMQFIEATVQIIHEEGLHGTTLSRVARRAGASPGLVAHYFGDKSGLLHATFRHLARALGTEFRDRLIGIREPRARLMAVIDANFAESQSSPAVVSAWLAFWGQVNHRPELARVQRVVTGRLKSNLLYSLRELADAEAAERIASGLAVMIDGLWLRAMLRTGGLNVAEARSMARDYLTAHLLAHQSEMMNA
ncbi:transcriptional regulator BetI [Aquisalimonas lutea]|uniref:choline-binding transcriptional repressor BetI n=1 Tax=Aquisalimonas lutea TaxID=1327750 RepID=UPI0025B5297D|nr:transcriptional regulator BetI [Aquisalimonas lutea]MDN3516736.1 transcriptional regulator BetI [Aquisalimonas lutea]